MKLGIWTHYFSGLSPEDKLQAIADSGFRYAELSSEDGHELLGRGDPREVGEAYRVRAEAIGVQVLQGHLDLAANIRHPESMQALKRWLDLFHAAGVKYCVLHYSNDAEMVIPPFIFMRARVRAIRELRDYIGDRDMNLCIENLPVRYDRTCDHLLKLLRLAGPEKLGICLDTGHLNIAGGSPGAFVLRARQYLKALHICDNDGQGDDHILPLGSGTVPWEDFMRAFNSIDYQGVFSYELPGENEGPLEVRMTRLAYLQEISEYLFQIR